MMHKITHLTHLTHSIEETQALAAEWARSARIGDVFCLSGPLGVGKTAFAQGFAAGLAVAEPVTSPTFTLMQMYTSGRLPFYHFDLYRTEGPDLDFEDYIYGDGVCLIEWAEFAQDALRAVPNVFWITITPQDDGTREIVQTVYKLYTNCK